MGVVGRGVLAGIVALGVVRSAIFPFVGYAFFEFARGFFCPDAVSAAADGATLYHSSRAPASVFFAVGVCPY